MSADKLLYDDNYWKEMLEKDIRRVPLERKLHLIFTLVMFLQVSVAQLLNFIFTSEVKEVRARAARFLGHTPTATLKDMEFLPGMVFRAWHENFPKAKAQLHKMVEPCAIEMVPQVYQNTLAAKGNSWQVSPSRTLHVESSRNHFSIAKQTSQVRCQNRWFWGRYRTKSGLGWRSKSWWRRTRKKVEFENSTGVFPQPNIGRLRSHAKNVNPLMMGLFLKINGTRALSRLMMRTSFPGPFRTARASKMRLLP